MDVEDGGFRYREPPKVTWFLEYEGESVEQFIYGAKGLAPIIAIRNGKQTNRIMPDIIEIGGIDNLRSRKLLTEAVSMAYTQADFQGKRVIALLKKEGFTSSDQTFVEEICKKFYCKHERIGKWTFAAVIETLQKIDQISKEEYNYLNNLRSVRNSLQHIAAAKYTIDTNRIDSILCGAIQVLLRLRELPIGLHAEITGYELNEFWADIGFGGSPQNL